ncbi:MAG: hypothetical protein U9N45_00010 [Gemmatimonadota bacterium]|nr:hypothetical protein [Gemmatimonadota bacterium]
MADPTKKDNDLLLSREQLKDLDRFHSRFTDLQHDLGSCQEEFLSILNRHYSSREEGYLEDQQENLREVVGLQSKMEALAKKIFSCSGMLKSFMMELQTNLQSQLSSAKEEGARRGSEHVELSLDTGEPATAPSQPTTGPVEESAGPGVPDEMPSEPEEPVEEFAEAQEPEAAFSKPEETVEEFVEAQEPEAAFSEPEETVEEFVEAQEPEAAPSEPEKPVEEFAEAEELIAEPEPAFSEPPIAPLKNAPEEGEPVEVPSEPGEPAAATVEPGEPAEAQDQGVEAAAQEEEATPEKPALGTPVTREAAEGIRKSPVINRTAERLYDETVSGGEISLKMIYSELRLPEPENQELFSEISADLMKMLISRKLVGYSKSSLVFGRNRTLAELLTDLQEVFISEGLVNLIKEKNLIDADEEAMLRLACNENRELVFVFKG